MPRNGKPVIHASELGQFAFCRSAWWLERVRGLPATNVAARTRGNTLHQEHGRRVRRAVGLHKAAACALGLALLFVVIGLALILKAAGGSL